MTNSLERLEKAEKELAKFSEVERNLESLKTAAWSLLSFIGSVEAARKQLRQAKASLEMKPEERKKGSRKPETELRDAERSVMEVSQSFSDFRMLREWKK